MITKSLDLVKSNPGIWVVMTSTSISFIESEDDGTIHQLKPDTFERDGVLLPGGWNLVSITRAIGPLARIIAEQL
jgi:hypothetical protein